MSVDSYLPFLIASPSNPMYDLSALNFEASCLQSYISEKISPFLGETIIYILQSVDPT